MTETVPRAVLLPVSHPDLHPVGAPVVARWTLDDAGRPLPVGGKPRVLPGTHGAVLECHATGNLLVGWCDGQATAVLARHVGMGLGLDASTRVGRAILAQWALPRMLRPGEDELERLLFARDLALFYDALDGSDSFDHWPDRIVALVAAGSRVSLHGRRERQPLPVRVGAA